MRGPEGTLSRCPLCAPRTPGLILVPRGGAGVSVVKEADKNAAGGASRWHCWGSCATKGSFGADTNEDRFLFPV